MVSSGHDAGDGQRKVNGWTNIVSIDTGWRHTVGLDSNGIVHITGYGSSSQLLQIEQNADDWSDIVSISAGGGGPLGDGHTVGLKKDGTVVAVGDNRYGQCNVKDWTDIIAVSAGDWHTVGLRSDGTVLATGADGNGYDTSMCRINEWTDIVAVSAGSGFTLGLKSDGTVVSSGYDDAGKGSNTELWDSIMVYEEWANK